MPKACLNALNSFLDSGAGIAEGWHCEVSPAELPACCSGWLAFLLPTAAGGKVVPRVRFQCGEASRATQTSNVLGKKGVDACSHASGLCPALSIKLPQLPGTRWLRQQPLALHLCSEAQRAEHKGKQG